MKPRKRIKRATRLPTWRAGRTDDVLPGVDLLSTRSMLDAADGFEQPAGAPGKKKGGILKALRRAPSNVAAKPSRAAKSRYITAADVLADLPPPEIAKKFRIDPVKKAFIAPPFSDHLFADALSLSLHSIAARKILRDPSILRRAQRTLERWMAKHRPAPGPFVEWLRILAGTPDEIAAVALSMTEEATRLRSSSPLGCLLTPDERAAAYAVFGKNLPNTHRTKALNAFLADWERRHGAFTAGELRAAAASIESSKVRASSEARRTRKPKAFARILAQAIKTFGSQDNAEAWLNSPVVSLEMKRPIDLLATTKGAKLVETILGRIEYGTYS
jgi:putative toxin-antitoxin system antitoxin component (TIGR02293 family)